MKAKQQAIRNIRNSENAQEVFDSVMFLSESVQWDVMNHKNGALTEVQKEVDEKFWKFLMSGDDGRIEAKNLYDMGIVSKTIQKGEFCNMVWKMLYFKNAKYKRSYFQVISQNYAWYDQ